MQWRTPYMQENWPKVFRFDDEKLGKLLYFKEVSDPKNIVDADALLDGLAAERILYEAERSARQEAEAMADVLCARLVRARRSIAFHIGADFDTDFGDTPDEWRTWAKQAVKEAGDE